MQIYKGMDGKSPKERNKMAVEYQSESLAKLFNW